MAIGLEMVCIQAYYYHISFVAVRPVTSNNTIHNPAEHHYHTYPVYCITKLSSGWPRFSESLPSYLDMKDCHAIWELFHSGCFKRE